MHINHETNAVIAHLKRQSLKRVELHLPITQRNAIPTQDKTETLLLLLPLFHIFTGCDTRQVRPTEVVHFLIRW